MDDLVVGLVLLAALAVLVALGWYGVVRDRAIYTGLPSATSASMLAAMGVGFYSGEMLLTIAAGVLAFGVVFVPLWRVGRSIHGKIPGLGNFEPYHGPTTSPRGEAQAEGGRSRGSSTYSGGGGDFGGGGASGDY